MTETADMPAAATTICVTCDRQHRRRGPECHACAKWRYRHGGRTRPATAGRERAAEPDPVPPTGWMHHAACADGDPAWWTSPDRGDQDRAVAICRTCPAVDDCRDYATALPGPADIGGVWAGLRPAAVALLRRQAGHRRG